ncbi:MAG: VanZ family protein [Clostridiales Family XIII bacterium]|jgi:glycopeptide antibiotics resistance protein|nr:VanZ family protein [Clostridiales Family XIII bacterium]
MVFLFVFYLQTAYYLVILPLPDPAKIVGHKPLIQYMNLVPFEFVLDYIHKAPVDWSKPITILKSLKTSYVLEPVFNLFLTVPFGVFLSYYFKKSIRFTVIASFALSLFYELSQLSALFGYYAHPYRVFDVDDLLLNTLGGLVGALIALKFNPMLPSRKGMDRRSYEKGLKVSYPRRLLALTVDAIIAETIAIAVMFLVALIRGNGDTPHIELIIWTAYFILQEVFFNGKTLGKRLVKIRLARVDDVKNSKIPIQKIPTWLCLVLRNILRQALYLMISYVIFDVSSSNAIYSLAMIIVAAALLLFTGIDFVLSFKRGRRLWYEILSGTCNVSYVVDASFGIDANQKDSDAARDSSGMDIEKVKVDDEREVPKPEKEK